MNGKLALKIAGVSSLVLIGTFVLLEAMIAFMLTFPRFAHYDPTSTVRDIYFQAVRNIIQYLPACGRHHPRLGYTLQPGTCVFSNLEFTNEFRINSLGVRDDEASLAAPEIVVVGDSHAMGWGVDQEDTYSQILERETGLKVLNAAIASFGTVRKVGILDLIDTRKLKYLVFHYAMCDYQEDHAFMTDGNELKSMTQKEYADAVETHVRTRPYFPGKYATVSLNLLFARLVGRSSSESNILEGSAESGADRVDLFLNALTHASEVDFESVQVIVLETRLGAREKPFMDSLRERVGVREYPSFIERLIMLDLSLSGEDRYPLDGHLNARGHRLVADALLAALREEASAGRG